MKCQVTIADITYIRTQDAARAVGLAPDSIARLAQAHLIDGHRVNGTWFVDLASLKIFIVDQKVRQSA